MPLLWSVWANVFGMLSIVLFLTIIFLFARDAGRTLPSQLRYLLLLPASYFYTTGFSRNPRRNCRLFHFVLLLIFLLFFSMPFLRNTTFGSPFEIENYDAQYYVMVSRGDGKYYKLPADISRDSEQSDTQYLLTTAYWNNGGQLNFGDELYVSPNTETTVDEWGGEKLLVVLTTEPVLDYVDKLRWNHFLAIAVYGIFSIFCIFTLSQSSKFSREYFNDKEDVDQEELTDDE